MGLDCTDRRLRKAQEVTARWFKETIAASRASAAAAAASAASLTKAVSISGHPSAPLQGGETLVFGVALPVTFSPSKLELVSASYGEFASRLVAEGAYGTRTIS